MPGAYEVGGYFGASKIDSGGTAIDAIDYGLTMKIERPTFAVYGGIHATNPDIGGQDLLSYGVGGAYAFSDSISMFAGAGQWQLSGPGGGSLNALGLGAAYTFNGVSSVPVSVGLEYSRLGGDLLLGGASANVYKLSISIPLGEKGPVVPVDSVAGGLKSPMRSVYSDIFATVY
jgi:hypothetical protein